jgi:hypothetical protein
MEMREICVCKKEECKRERENRGGGCTYCVHRRDEF